MNHYKNMTNCPNCSSNRISYDIKKATLECEHCHQIFESKKVEKKIKEINTIKGLIFNEQRKTVSKSDKELYGIKCSNCGAIKYTKDKEKYKYCRLCGNKTYKIIDVENENVKYILPFLINREEAYEKHKNALDKRQFYSYKRFLSKFSEENLIGVYVPYRIENINYSCSMDGDGYTICDIKISDDRKTYVVKKYKINRDVEVNAKDIYYERIDEDIITREDMMENIISEVSPYDVKEKIELNKDYLEEYMVLYPNEVPVSSDTKKEKLSNIAKYAVLDDVLKYDYGIHWNNIDCQIIDENHSYVYLPIWLYYKEEKIGNKKEYCYIAINGRTNEIGMQLPFNKTKALITSGFLATIVLVILSLLLKTLLNISMIEVEGFYIVSILILIISTLIFSLITYYKYQSIKVKYKGSNIINENDRLIDIQKKIISSGEEPINVYNYFGKELVDRNDNFYHNNKSKSNQ